MKKCLIVVDYQNDFVTGSLGFKDAKNIEHAILEKLKFAKENKTDIVFTLDTHYKNYLQTLEGAKLPVEHCIDETNGHNVYGSVSKQIEDAKIVFKKETFGSLALGEFLKTEHYDQVELVGLVTHMCVLSNAVIAKAALPNARIIVDEYACESFDERLHNYTLDILEGIHIEVNRIKH